MKDQQLWNIGVERINKMRAAVPSENVLMLTQLLTRCRTAKEKYAAVVAETGATSVCRDCAGQCCQNGKYRLTACDALARSAAGITTAADFSQKPLCPYGTVLGCSMEPGLRPTDCVLFICEAIDTKLTPQSRIILAAAEQELRECIGQASRLTGEPLETPLLLWAAHQKQNNHKV